MARLIHNKPMLGAILLLSAMICCQPANERAITSSISTITLPLPSSHLDAGSIDASDIDASSHKMPDPHVGSRPKRSLYHNSSAKISEDGQFVVIWTNNIEPLGQEGDSDTRYLIAKRVKDNEEFFRMMIADNPGGIERCPPRWDECSKSVLQERTDREQRFLSKHSSLWTEFEYFYMEDPPENTKDKAQRLVFPNLHIFFDDLVLRVHKSSGELLLKRKFTGWNAYINPSSPGYSDKYFVAFLGIDLPHRVLLIALAYARGNDPNLRFHLVRLPPTWQP